jgi:DNA invertase Pin-like site-specific DNA recombinase
MMHQAKEKRFQVLLVWKIGAVAGFERDTMSERVKAGLQNAKRKGKTLISMFGSAQTNLRWSGNH